MPPALAAAVVAALLVALLPRAGWLIAAAGDHRPARRSARSSAPARRCSSPRSRPAPPLLLRADGRAWSLPSAAPAARAGRPRRRVSRARRPRAALDRPPRARRARRLVPSCSPSRCSSRTLVFGDARRDAGARRLRRRARDHRRRRDRAASAAPARCCWRVIWARRRARAAVAGARPLARRPTSSRPRRGARAPRPPAIALGEWLGDRVGQAEPRGAGARRGRRGWRVGARARPHAPPGAAGRGILTTAARAAILVHACDRVGRDERAAQPRIQARRTGRGHVLARLQVRGPAGGDRAQAGARDGRAPRPVAEPHLRAERVRRLALARRTASSSPATRTSCATSCRATCSSTPGASAWRC